MNILFSCYLCIWGALSLTQAQSGVVDFTHHNKTDQTITHTAIFRDINLFTLTGLKKIETKPSYPYIQIDNIDSKERNIIYYVDETFNVNRNYKRNGDYWVANYTEIGDTSIENVYEYILPSKVIKLKYLKTSNAHTNYLREVSILEKWKETIYLIQDDLLVVPGVKVPDVVKAKAQIIYTKRISIKNGVLNLHEHIFDKTRKHIPDKETCYKIEDQSYFGWLYLNLNKEFVACN